MKFKPTHFYKNNKLQKELFHYQQCFIEIINILSNNLPIIIAVTSLSDELENKFEKAQG
jgi:hypothetical protein